MTSNKGSTSNFWFGFALGTLSAVGGAYLLGTQKGREQLKRLLESADQWDNDPEKLVKMIQGMIPQSTGAAGSDHHSNSAINSIASILEKVKDMTKETGALEKKFFRNGK